MKIEGAMVRKIRRTVSMTQEGFGKALGFKHPQIRISEIERGLRGLSKKKLEILRQFVPDEIIRQAAPIQVLPRVRKL